MSWQVRGAFINERALLGVVIGVAVVATLLACQAKGERIETMEEYADKVTCPDRTPLPDDLDFESQAQAYDREVERLQRMRVPPEFHELHAAIIESDKAKAALLRAGRTDVPYDAQTKMMVAFEGLDMRTQHFLMEFCSTRRKELQALSPN